MGECHCSECETTEAESGRLADLYESKRGTGMSSDETKHTEHYLEKENARLRAVHEAELGVCEQHCEVVADLRAKLAGARKKWTPVEQHVRECMPDMREYFNNHSGDDHRVTIDHKDEMDLCELAVLCIDAAMDGDGDG